MNKQTNEPDRTAILTHGYPVRDYNSEIRLGNVRPFDSRKHFMFLGDFSKDSCSNMFHHLVYQVWPLISGELPDA